jgi:hypothetical protein
VRHDILVLLVRAILSRADESDATVMVAYLNRLRPVGADPASDKFENDDRQRINSNIDAAISTILSTGARS